MILVDTSAWIDYFNGVVNPETEYLDSILTEEPVLVGDIILSEILQGVRKDEEFDQVLSALSSFEIAKMINPDLAVQSARNYGLLRKRGITIRKTIDCFIATFCMEMGCWLLHRDQDFDPFEEHLGLRVSHSEQ